MNEIYLNHAGTSWPKPAVVVEAVRAAMEVAPSDWPDRFEEAHQAIADYFAAPSSEQILLTPGCTSALAVGIGDTLIPSGKRILISAWEHHALHRPVLQRAATDVTVETIPPRRDAASGKIVDSLDLAWLEQALSKRDVALVALTAACNVTGECLPYEQVIGLVRKYDATVLLDAAQVVGWSKLDLTRLDADLVAFGGHKGLQAPWGIGGLYMSERVQMQCATAACELPRESSRQPLTRPGYCDVGSVDQFALAGLHAAIRMLSQRDAQADLAHARSQIRRIQATLQRYPQLQVLRATDEGMPSLAFRSSSRSSGQLAADLKRHGLVVSSGIQCATLAHQTLGTADEGVVRISVGVGQADAEIDDAVERFAAALDES